MTAPGRHWRPATGFTLIELLVVLTIIAALAAISTPEFPRLYARVRVSLEQDDLRQQLLSMPQKVRETGRSGILYSSAGTLADAAETLGKTSEADSGVENWLALRILIPEGWSMQVSRPIFYHFNGTCDGGTVTFSLPPLALTYSLTAPLCRPQLTNPANG